MFFKFINKHMLNQQEHDESKYVIGFAPRSNVATDTWTDCISNFRHNMYDLGLIDTVSHAGISTSTASTRA